jgi:FkbM family methyltransferase
MLPVFAIARRRNTHHLGLLGKSVEIVEPLWSVVDFVEIFWHQMYHFVSRREQPYIIDCGANVGMAVIYFMHLYPESSVVAFEPDPTVFSILQKNLSSFSVSGVTAINKAVWTSDSTMQFVDGGGVGGRLANCGAVSTAIDVEAVRLRPFLERKVDFLKIDIEGAELAVLRDCRSVLGNVDHVFVEFHGSPHRSQELHDLLSLLADSGFRYYVTDARGDHRPLDFDWRWRRYDIQVNVFAVREEIEDVDGPRR